MRRRHRRSSVRRSSVRRRSARRGHLGVVHRLRHHPLAYWALVGGLSLSTGLFVTSLTREARATVAAYGTTERVAVARHTIDAGERLARGDIEWRDLPSALLPDTTTGDVDDIVDRVARDSIYAGEPIVSARLASQGVSGLAALVPAGRQAIAVPISVGAPALAAGDVVDLLAVVDPDPTGPPAARVARRAPVVDVTTEAIVVAVDDDEVRATAFALSTGSIVIALTSPDD